MKKISRTLLLISFYYLISCNYDLYENHFSIFFNQARNIKNEEQSFGDEKLNNLFYSNIYSGVKFGNNKEAIDLFLSFDNSEIKIISKPNNSTKPQEKEKFYFPKAKQEINLTFILDETNKEKINNNSYLGLSLYDNDKNKKSFINQLKENKIIKNRIFSLLYKDNSIADDLTYDGEILFGLYPHEMTSRYSVHDLNWVSVINNSWKVKLDLIKFNNEEVLTNINEVEFDIGNNLNIGPEIYREKIYEKYFKKFIEKKICKEEVFYNQKEKQFFLAYSCNHDLDVDEMSTLSFYNKELNYSITMDYNQLLCVYEGVIYFKFVFKKNKEKLLPFIKKWILSEHVYTVRFGVSMLMKHFLNDDFSEEYLEMVCSVKNGDYYVKMMVAWYFATALAMQYDSALPYIEQKKLEPWTHNKAIQKACESFRVKDEHKEYLRTLKTDSVRQ